LRYGTIEASQRHFEGVGVKVAFVVAVWGRFGGHFVGRFDGWFRRQFRELLGRCLSAVWGHFLGDEVAF